MYSSVWEERDSRCPNILYKSIKVYSSHKLSLVHILIHGPPAQINHANYSKFESMNFMMLKIPQYFLNTKKQNIVGLLCQIVTWNLFSPESHGKGIGLISLSNQKSSISRNSHQHVFCLSPTQVAIVPTTTVKMDKGLQSLSNVIQ